MTDWTVCIHGSPEEGYEISVARESNDWAWQSWGWDDENKIIIASTTRGNAGGSKNFDMWVKRANCFAEALNKLETNVF